MRVLHACEASGSVVSIIEDIKIFVSFLMIYDINYVGMVLCAGCPHDLSGYNDYHNVTIISFKNLLKISRGVENFRSIFFMKSNDSMNEI